MPEFNLNLILHPDPRQFRTPLPIQRKRGPGACPPPPRGLQKKKKSPGFPLVTGGANRSRVCTKRAEPWGCPGAQQNKAFKEQKRCPPPLFRPGHRLKYRSKAIKIWEPQKKHRPFFFFLCYAQNHDFARDKTGL